MSSSGRKPAACSAIPPGQDPASPPEGAEVADPLPTLIASSLVGSLAQQPRGTFQKREARGLLTTGVTSYVGLCRVHGKA